MISQFGGTSSQKPILLLGSACLLSTSPAVVPSLIDLFVFISSAAPQLVAALRSTAVGPLTAAASDNSPKDQGRTYLLNFWPATVEQSVASTLTTHLNCLLSFSFQTIAAMSAPRERGIVVNQKQSSYISHP